MSNKIKTEMKEVITNDGIFYYQIEESRTFDYLRLYTKRTNRTSWKIFGKEFFIKHDLIYDLIPGNDWEGATFLKKDGDRIKNIKYVINKVLEEKKHFDPQWDGIMCDDKATLRDLIINKLLTEDD